MYRFGQSTRRRISPVRNCHVRTAGTPARVWNHGRRRGRPHGFTLLELMIVLSVLALLVSIAWPSLRRPLMRSTAQQAARQLVRDVARARMAAIESGRTMALRFQPGGSRYTVAPAEAAVDPSDVAQSGPVTQADRDVREPSDGTDAERDTEEPEWRLDGEFEYDVVFRDPAAVDNELMLLDSSLGESLRQEYQETESVQPLVGKEDAEQEFSPPILFYPTGRAENASFVLDSPDGYSVTVTLRGLTGAVKIGPVQQAARDGPAAERPGDAGELPDNTPRRKVPAGGGPSSDNGSAYAFPDTQRQGGR